MVDDEWTLDVSISAELKHQLLCEPGCIHDPEGVGAYIPFDPRKPGA